MRAGYVCASSREVTDVYLAGACICSAGRPSRGGLTFHCLPARRQRAQRSAPGPKGQHQVPQPRQQKGGNVGQHGPQPRRCSARCRCAWRSFAAAAVCSADTCWLTLASLATALGCAAAAVAGRAAAPARSSAAAGAPAAAASFAAAKLLLPRRRCHCRQLLLVGRGVREGAQQGGSPGGLGHRDRLKPNRHARERRLATRLLHRRVGEAQAVRRAIHSNPSVWRSQTGQERKASTASALPKRSTPAGPASCAHPQRRLGQVSIQHEHGGSRQGGRHARPAQQRRPQLSLQQCHVGHAGRHLATQVKHHGDGGGRATWHTRDAARAQPAGQGRGRGVGCVLVWPGASHAAS